MKLVAGTISVQVASPVASETKNFPEPTPPPVIFTCQATSSRAHGVAVPIPTLPEVSIRIRSILLVIIGSTWLDIVPRFWVAVNVLPPTVQKEPEREGSGSYQLAIPVVSDIRSLPEPGEPPRIRICPFTSSVAVGD